MKKIFLLSFFSFYMALCKIHSQNCANLELTNVTVVSKDLGVVANTTNEKSGEIQFKITGGLAPYIISFINNGITYNSNPIASQEYSLEIKPAVFATLYDEANKTFNTENVVFSITDKNGCTSNFEPKTNFLQTNIFTKSASCTTNDGSIKIELPNIETYQKPKINVDSLRFLCAVNLTQNITNLNINDGKTYCITSDINVQNMNVNNGNVIVFGNAIFSNYTHSLGTFITIGSSSFSQDIEVKNNVAWSNYGNFTSNNLIVSGLFKNYSKFISNKISINGNGNLANVGDLDATTIEVNGKLEFNGKQKFTNFKTNGGGKVYIDNCILEATNIYTDGTLFFAGCAKLKTSKNEGNKKIASVFLCNSENCTCPIESHEIVWSDGFKGDFRENLSAGEYHFDVVVGNEIIATQNIKLESKCEPKLEDYFAVYPNPRVDKAVPQHFEISLSAYSFVEIDLYSRWG